MKIGFIGLGNMGKAVAQAVAKVEGHSLLLSHHNPQKAGALQNEIGGDLLSNQTIAKEADLIFLGVKPHLLDMVLGYLKDTLAEDRDVILVSMLAGVSLSDLSEYLPSENVIRMMPNTPIGIGSGMTTYTTQKENLKSIFEELMAHAGQVMFLPESEIDAATAIAGSGPAFVHTFIEALIDAGIKNGLTFDQSKALASQTIIGAGELVQKSAGHPAELKHQVTSPGGSTIAGVAKLEEHAFRHAVIEAVDASFHKIKSLK